ncbi:MAG: tetratricopeptide repeat protein [Saprospiraceae bacterium]|nr:tetratricopeptide repeat protein [Saprospiraceae bacterium]
MKFFSFRNIFLIFILIFAISCVTTRKKGETSALGRFYHNTTAKYNGYFNANEIFNESILALETNHKDNYNKTLAVFPYQAIESADVVKANLDKAIEKVSIDITLHRVSRWADDCYLLLAQSQYLKKDYETAENSFRFLIDEFNPYKKKTTLNKIKAKTAKQKKEDAKDKKEETRKKIKEKKKAREKAKKEAAKRKKSKTKGSKNVTEVVKEEKLPEIPAVKIEKEKNNDEITNEGNKLIPHRPAYWEGLLWSGKNLIERGKYYEAQSQFKELEKDPNTPSRLKAELYASIADLHLKNGKKDEAITSLRQAIALTKSKKVRARYNYIIGQLYQQQNRFVNSNEYFTNCHKLKPNYDMAFHAKLNTFLNDAKAGENTEVVRNGLLKLIKDPKNIDYAGEIYFTLAQLSLQQKNVDEVVQYLNQSIQSPNTSTSQKADSYLLLAQMNFDQQNYLKAKYYYDSTLLNITKNDPRRAELGAIAANLSEIASNLEIINLNDSLIQLSTLNVKEKRALAIKIKSEKKNKNAEILSPPQSLQLNQNGFNLSETSIEENFNRTKQVNSTFFAYDDRLRNRGRSEFKDYWGNRVLEDHWRRENKNSFTFNEIDIKKNEESGDSLEADLAQILSGIPNTPQEIEAANKKIQEAMYALGILYREKINNYSKSTGTLESLISKYPNTERKPDALYYLYLNCLDQNDAACSLSYSDKIKYEYPDSRYGKYLTDPESARSEFIKKDEISTNYKKAYALYESGKYDDAFNLLQAIKSKLNSPHVLSPKIALLSAFCVAKTQGKDVYINALRDVIANFPATTEETKAKEILRFLKGDKDAFLEVTSAELNSAQFKIEDDKLHYAVVVLFKPEDKLLDKIKISISDYNIRYHKTENLKMSMVDLDPDNNLPLIHIKKFDNKDMAMKYYKGVERKPKEFCSVFENYEIYIINQTNYREILKLKTFKEYSTFFKQNYLNNEQK